MKKSTCLKQAALVLALGTGFAHAGNPIQLSLTPEIQIVKKAEPVSGVRLSIWNENTDVSGFDLGIVNQTKGDFTGLGIGVVNLTDGNLTGVQFSIWGVSITKGDSVGWNSGTFFNQVHGNMSGLQGGLVALGHSNGLGLQSGMVSITDGDFTGWQIGGLYGNTRGHMKGLQTGIVNRASSVSGLQLGLVNLTENMYGVQIGLLNNIKNSKLPWFVFANAKF